MGCDALVQRARLLFERDESAQAEAILRRALSSSTSDPLALIAIGDLLLQTGRFAQAEHYLRKSLQARPDDPSTLERLAKSLIPQRRSEEAHGLLERALDVDPACISARVTLATSLRRLNRTWSALTLLRQAMHPSVNDSGLLSAYAHTLHAMGRIDDALPILRQITDAMPSHAPAIDGLCSVLNYAPGVSPAEVRRVHEQYGLLIERAAGAPPRPAGAGAPRGPGRPLRVGLLSNDLCDSVITTFIRGFIEHAPRDRVRLSCLSTCPVEDDASAQLMRHADSWRRLTAASHTTVAEAIRREHIDVLVELNGHTRGHRLPSVALRPAPLIVSYLGYPATTGLRAVDRRIVDSTTDPAGAASHVTEQLERVDPCFLCYAPPDAPRVNVRPSGPTIFVSFTHLLKLNQPLVELWSRVLKAVPDSRLIMKHFALTEQGVRDDLAMRFASLGVDPARLDLRPPAAAFGDHLAAYHHADICLDTHPYNGTTTVFESLLMGVPVVTRRGRAHAGRVTESILTGIGLQELVATDDETYVQVAADLASDEPRRAQLRATLRTRLLASPLCDQREHATRLVDALYRAWNEVGARQAVPAASAPVQSGP